MCAVNEASQPESTPGEPVFDTVSCEGTVVSVDERLLPDPLTGVLSRVESLRNGLSASMGLPCDDALIEAVLLLDDALARSRAALAEALVSRDGLSLLDVRLLLSAERYWLEILKDMLVTGEDLPAPARLHQVLASLPG